MICPGLDGSRQGQSGMARPRSAAKAREKEEADGGQPHPFCKNRRDGWGTQICLGVLRASQANRDSPTFGSRWIRSASGRGLEPLDRSAPRGRFSAAHGCLQPHRYAVPCNCPATGTAFLGFQWGDRWYFRRRKPVGAGACEGPFGGNRRGTLADRACERQL